jgi:hypothetical protein
MATTEPTELFSAQIIRQFQEFLDSPTHSNREITEEAKAKLGSVSASISLRKAVRLANPIIPIRVRRKRAATQVELLQPATQRSRRRENANDNGGETSITLRTV